MVPKWNENLLRGGNEKKTGQSCDFGLLKELHVPREIYSNISKEVELNCTAEHYVIYII